MNKRSGIKIKEDKKTFKMSAKDLEDFINVIETAEGLSARPQSSIWSYPTDIFSRASPRKVAPRPSNAPIVPKLWDPKAGSDFLGSSWGSSSRGCGPSSPMAAAAPSSSSRSGLTTVRSVSKSEEATSKDVSSSLMTPRQPNMESPKKDPGEVRDFNTLMNMQKHNRFARSKAKELLSSISPSNSPRPSRKATSTSRSPSSSPMKTPVKKSSVPGTPKSPGRPVTAKASPAKASPAKASPSSRSSVDASPAKTSFKKSSIHKKLSSSSASSSVEVVEAVSPKYSSSSSSKSTEIQLKASSASSKNSFARSMTIRNHEDDEEEPRSPPKPRPRVSIRQDSVQVHVHKQESPQKQVTPKKKVRKLRPKSAPPTKQQPQLVDLRSYSKSLKLLGMDIPSNRTEATKIQTHTLEIQTKSPTLKTRLKGRTQSVSDLREVVDSKHHLAKEEYSKIKTNLATAVFEEWYFVKLKEMVAKKREKDEKLEDELYDKEAEMVEKKEKAAMEYKKWLDEKQTQLKKLAKKKKSTLEKSELDAEKVAKIKKAEEEWKAKKAEELKKHQRLKRRLLKKQDQEQDKQRVKKEDAQKHFIKWQEGWSDKMKDKMTEEKKKKLEEIEAKKAAAKEKSESAAAAFKGWTAKKVEDSKKSPQIKAPKKAGSKTDENGNNDKHERLEAARDAYDNWLEYVEQREEEERFAEEERVLREMWRPPWYPAGIADF